MTEIERMPRYFVLLVDDDPGFGEVARRLDGPLCEVRWVPCAGVEAEVRRRRPDYVIGFRVKLDPSAERLLVERAAEAGRRAVVFHSIPAWAIEHLVHGFVCHAERGEAPRPAKSIEA